MRILFLGWEYPPRVTGGLGAACEALARALGALGAEVTVVVPWDPGTDGRASSPRVLGAETPHVPERGSPPGDVAPAVAADRLRARLRRLRIASPLAPYMRSEDYARRVSHVRRVEPSPTPRRGGYGPDLFAEVERYASAVARLAGRLDFDVVHAHDWMTWPAGLLAREATGRPLVCHVHATELDRAGGRPDERIVEIERFALAAADRIVCVSRYTRDVLARGYGLGGAGVRVVHNAVAPPPLGREIRPPRDRRGPLVLFLGRVTSQKDPATFVEAAARVAAAVPDARFLLAGAGDLLPAMVERAAELGIGRRLSFAGFLDGPDVERAYALADVFVLPSASEPFGLAPLEAAARGVPVIVSRRSGVTEVLGSGLVVDPGDVDALADKIVACLRRPALRRQLEEDGRREVGGLSWERSARELRSVLAEVTE